MLPNNFVVHIGHRQFDNGLIDFSNGFSVQGHMFIFVLHVTLHRRQQVSIPDRPLGKVIVNSMRVFLAIEVEVKNKAMQDRITADIAMQATLDGCGDQVRFMRAGKRRIRTPRQQ